MTDVSVDRALSSAGMLDEGVLTGLLDIFSPSELAELIATYLDQSTDQLSMLRNADSRRDGPGVRTAAHALKSPSATLGCMLVAAACQELEELGPTGTAAGKIDALGRILDASRLELVRYCELHLASPRTLTSTGRTGA